jgi:hypothetical protein
VPTFDEVGVVKGSPSAGPNRRQLDQAGFLLLVGRLVLARRGYLPCAKKISEPRPGIVASRQVTTTRSSDTTICGNSEGPLLLLISVSLLKLRPLSPALSEEDVGAAALTDRFPCRIDVVPGRCLLRMNSPMAIFSFFVGSKLAPLFVLPLTISILVWVPAIDRRDQTWSRSLLLSGSGRSCHNL